MPAQLGWQLLLAGRLDQFFKSKRGGYCVFAKEWYCINFARVSCLGSHSRQDVRISLPRHHTCCASYLAMLQYIQRVSRTATTELGVACRSVALFTCLQ